jgi:hypothetical protein
MEEEIPDKPSIVTATVKEQTEFPICEVVPENEENMMNLTDKDHQFVKLFEASGFDFSRRSQLAVAAGFQPGATAKANAGRIIKTLANNKAMQRALKRHGVDNNKLALKIKELLDCEHPAFIGRPDNMAQIKATEMALRVKDAFPATKIDVDKTERKEIVISAEVIARLEKYERFRDVDVTDVTVVDSPD